jgi:hypothetical protein
LSRKTRGGLSKWNEGVKDRHARHCVQEVKIRVQEQAQLSSQDAGEVLFVEAKLRGGEKQHEASEQGRPLSSYMTGW